MTEAASVLCTNCNNTSKIGSLGIPFVRTVVKVVDTETGNELKFEEQGELWFHTPSLMEGYYKNDDDTRKILTKDNEGKVWLRTGDLGYVDRDGFVFMSGRIKRIYYVSAEGGEVCRLFPSHLEEGFEKNATVATCAVIVREDNDIISTPVVYVTLKEPYKNENKNEVVAALKEYALKELPRHLRPRDIVDLDKVPLSQSGKIDYRYLEQLE